MEVDWKEASRFGLMVADEDDRITEFQEKPPVPKSNLASMGIYIFNWDILKKYLEEDEADPNSKNDFGMNIIPALLRDGRKMYAYHFNGYWRDVGTIDSLWEANMEVLDPENSGIDIFDEKWKIYSRNPVLPAQKIGPPRCGAGFAGHGGLPDLRLRQALCAERRHRRGRGRNGRGCRPDGWRRGQGRRSGQALHPR